jgi:2-amino-4-hydroxy-6-hydroxymethyldihydropteridine diphosphokinase
VYESEAVGFSGDAFYNLVVGLDTSLSVAQLSALLKGIEDANGRDRSAPRFCGRTLDIDILTYDQAVGEIDSVRLPRAEILKNAFVLQPLAEIAGAEVHPVVGATYAELWQAYAGQQKLWPVKFEWRETLLPARVKI